MNIFNTTASGLINHFLGSGIFPKPTGIAFGLTSNLPTNSVITEIANANGYTRVNYGQNAANVPFSGVNSLWSFPIEGSGIAYNNQQITFPVSTGPQQGTSGAFISDSAAYGGGNFLFYTNLPFAKDVEINDQIYIPISGAQVRFW